MIYSSKDVLSFDVQDLPLSPRQVNTKYGALRGVIIPLRSPSASSSPLLLSLSPVEAFFGVPYASPPTKSLRFMPPVTTSHWRGVRLATKFSPVCIQRLPDISNVTQTLKIMSTSRYEYLKRLIPFLKNQSEDCLYLNLFTIFYYITCVKNDCTKHISLLEKNLKNFHRSLFQHFDILSVYIVLVLPVVHTIYNQSTIRYNTTQSVTEYHHHSKRSTEQMDLFVHSIIIF